jgi:hypothetical protein
VRDALEAALRNAGLGVAGKSNTAPELRITLSENLQGLLWVAEVLREGASDVVMVSLPKISAPAPAAATQMFVLQSKLIYQQDDPILDFDLRDVPSGATPSLLVLEPARLAIYKLQNATWQPQQFVSISENGPWPRDVRGRLLINRTFSDLHIPGIHCQGGAPLRIDLKCEEDDAWTLIRTEEIYAGAVLAKGRNFFVDPRHLEGSPNRELKLRFYTIAGLGPRDEAIWLLSLLNGRTVLYTDIQTTKPQLQEGLTGWGSEIASIETECGRRWQVLASKPTDWAETDALQAFEVVEHMPIAVSSQISFPGPITALWTTTEGDSARAVVRNLMTNRYEAYTLTLSCGR